MQESLFKDLELPSRIKGIYLPVLTVSENRKGVLDVDTVKGCSSGLAKYPSGGCYGECYAYKNAKRYGIDFSVSVTRKLLRSQKISIFYTVKNHYASWYRVGTAGDPCHDWDNTISVCEFLKYTGKLPVIITKHWITLSDEQIGRLRNIHAVINTSTSGLDTCEEIEYRKKQIIRIKDAGIKSVCRIVTCDFGNSQFARECKEKQEYLMSLSPIIDNPLRASKSNKYVVSGVIKITRKEISIGGGKFVSLHNSNSYLGKCDKCPDQCGVDIKILPKKESREHGQTAIVFN